MLYNVLDKNIFRGFWYMSKIKKECMVFGPHLKTLFINKVLSIYIQNLIENKSQKIQNSMIHIQEFQNI